MSISRGITSEGPYGKRRTATPTATSRTATPTAISLAPTPTTTAATATPTTASPTATPTATPAPGAALFSDGFESGNFSAWSAVKTGADGAAT